MAGFDRIENEELFVTKLDHFGENIYFMVKFDCIKGDGCWI